MVSLFEDFHELIVTGHNARLTPEEIHQRFIDGGLPREGIPPVRDIRVIGCNLIGPSCRWRQRGRMTQWHSTTRHLQKNKKSI